MNNEKAPLPLWPFIVADALLLGIVGALLAFGHRPPTWQEACLLVLCGALGAWCFVTPFLRRNVDEQALSQAKLLTNATAQIQKLDQLAANINGATNQWLELKTHTEEAAESAKKVADTLVAEAKSLAAFMERSSEMERKHLRVEADKLRRDETERLQVIVFLLDHVYALFTAARHSGHPDLIEQIDRFQKDCLETVRRIGLVQVLAEAGQPYDPKKHQLEDEKATVESGTVAETIAAGYTYQTQVLRHPVVALKVATE